MTKPKLASPRSGFGGRGYRIPGHTDRYGKQLVYPSVTTVLEHSNKPGLYQWVADETAAYAVTHLSYLVNRTEEVGWRFLRHYWNRSPEVDGADLRLHYEVVKNDAAELGTNVHEHIEADIKGDVPYPPVLSEQVLEMLDAWEEWYAGHRIESHAVEFTVVHAELEYAGTADADWTIECTHDGPGCFDGDRGPYRCLVDFKSSRYTWPEHGMQLAGLARATTRMTEVPAGTRGAKRAEKVEDGVKVVSYWTEAEQSEYDRYVLLHIRPDDLDYQGSVIPAFCELEDRTPDIDIYWQGFQGALALCKAAHALNKRAQARGLRASIKEGQVA